VRRLAKASSVESLRDAIGVRGIFSAACLAALALIVLLVSEAPRAGAAGETCANAGIRAEQGSSYLPECRAYEQVSPVDKNGSDIKSVSYSAQSSIAPGVVNYESSGAFAGAQSLQARGTYLSQRTPGSGWQTAPVDPLQTTGEINVPGYHTQAFSDDLMQSFLKAGDPQPVPTAEAGGTNLYVRHNSTPFGSYELLTPNAVDWETSTQSGKFAGASADFSHVVFEAGTKFTPDATVEDPVFTEETENENGEIEKTTEFRANLYEWVGGPNGGTLRLVNILPDPDGSGPETGQASPRGGVAAGMRQASGIGGGDGASGQTDTQDQNAVSNDGSRIFWTSIAPRGQGERQLYARINGTKTVHISASQRTVPETPRDAFFTYATPDGRFVFFTSTEKLTDDSTADPGGTSGSALVDGQADLYRFDVDTGELIDLTVSDDPNDLGRAFGVVGASDDGQVVYFAAAGNLAPGSDGVPSEDATSSSGGLRPKLYLWDHGQLRFITTLNGFEESGVIPGLFSVFGIWDWNTQTYSGVRSGRVTPDGRYLLFRASLPTGPEPAPPYAQLYRFDALANPQDALRCVSCLPGGAPNTAQALLNGPEGGNGSSGSVRSPHISNPLLLGGQVVFQTAHALVPRDLNGKIDVYLWSEQGGPQLISSGQSPFDSFFADASPDGTDVYFTTRERLVGTDADANMDLYSARIEGGFPEPPAPPAPCAGEACQGRSSGSPGASGTASEAIAGSGNASARKPKARCAKNQRSVKKRGKATCVKKRGAKAKKKASAKKHGKQTATNRRG
jgi:hypothetical protein